MGEYTIGAIDLIELKALSNVKVEKEQNLIERYEAKSFSFQNGVRVVSENVMDYLLSMLKNERDVAINELVKTHSLKAQNSKLKNRNEVLKKEIESLKEELKELNQMYGKYVSPFSIIDELYRGNILEYMILKKREEFKLKISQKQFDYWVGVFISLKIVRRIDKSKLQSMVSFYEAHDILHKNDNVWNIEKE